MGTFRRSCYVRCYVACGNFENRKIRSIFRRQRTQPTSSGKSFSALRTTQRAREWGLIARCPVEPSGGHRDARDGLPENSHRTVNHTPWRDREREGRGPRLLLGDFGIPKI